MGTRPGQLRPVPSPHSPDAAALQPCCALAHSPCGNLRGPLPQDRLPNLASCSGLSPRVSCRLRLHPAPRVSHPCGPSCPGHPLPRTPHSPTPPVPRGPADVVGAQSWQLPSQHLPGPTPHGLCANLSPPRRGLQPRCSEEATYHHRAQAPDVSGGLLISLGTAGPRCHHQEGGKRRLLPALRLCAQLGKAHGDFCLRLEFCCPREHTPPVPESRLTTLSWLCTRLSTPASYT